MIRHTRRFKKAGSYGFKKLYLNNTGIKSIRRASFFRKGVSNKKYKKYNNIVNCDRIDYSDWKLNKR